MTAAGTSLGVLEPTTASGGDASASMRDAAKHERADHPTSSAGSDRSDKSRVASPTVSIDHLPLPPLDDLPCDIGSGDFGDVLANLADDDISDFLIPPVAADEGDHIFDASRDNLGFPGESVGGASSADSARASDENRGSGSGSGSRVERGVEDEKAEASADGGDDKKRARLVRNRESAQQSRARKKQYVDELERKCRDLGRANAELRAFASALMAECAGLRHHLHLATGKPPPPPGTVLPHPPPPGAAQMAAPKIALPPVGAVGVPTSGGVPKPARMPFIPAAPGSAAGSAPASPERLTPAKRRKKAPGGAVAAAVAATLAVLSVACVATAGSGRVSSGGDALRFAALAAPGRLALAASEKPFGGSGSGAARRLLAAEDANLVVDDADATAMDALEATRRASAMDDARSLTVSSGAIPLRGRGRSVAVRDDAGFVQRWFGESRRSSSDVGRGSVLDDDIDRDRSESDRGEDKDDDATGSTPRGGEDDPWYAAFRAAGMRRSDLLSRASCDEIFRFRPAEDGVGVAGEAFARRLREATERERDETRNRNDEDDEGEGEDVFFVAGRDRDDDARLGATPPPPRRPELPPSAIPLPPASPSAAARPDAREGPPPPPVAGRRLPDPGALIGGGGWGEDASLVSVLLPPAPTSAPADGGGLGVGSLSKIFVVAYSRRSADYVTYSCRLPKGRSVA